MNIPGRTFLTGESFYSDWMPRGGDDAIFRAQLIALQGTTVETTIKIYTKNREDTTDGEVVKDSTPADYDFGFDSSAGAGDTSQVIVQSVNSANRGLLELVRFKISVTGEAGDYHTIRIFPPVWMDRGITA